jgi:glycosyltransferase involved in cell wall biosynthesis
MTKPGKLRFLHLHSSFDLGGKERRAVQLMNAFGQRVEHTVVSAIPEALGAAHSVSGKVWASYPRDFPPLEGRVSPGRLLRLARAMQGFDLILTYNWGAMDAVMARRMLHRRLGLAPLVHHEDGFNADEALRLNPLRNLYRSLALDGAAAVAVPSQMLERIALQAWRLPRDQVLRIPNGIATGQYDRRPRPDALPRVIKHKGEFWLGTIAGLRPVKNLPRLVRAFASLPENWHLVILGEGPERDAIKAEAVRLEVGYRVHLPGFVAEPAKVIGLFDLFALSSDSEQFPLSVVEAMAAGLAVAAPDVGDVKAMLAPENRGFVSRPGDEGALAVAIEALARDPAKRAAIGAANRERAREKYDEVKMISAYRRLYAGAMDRDDL